MTDATAAPPRRKRGILRLILLMLAAAALTGGGFAGGVFWSGTRLSPSEEVLRLIERSSLAAGTATADPAHEKTPAAADGAEAFETRYYEFPDPLTTNLKGSRKFLQVGIGLSTQYDETVIANVEKHALAIRSDMLAVLGNATEDSLAGKDGRDQLAQQLRDAINARLETLENFGGVEGVFFPSFVLQ